MLDSLYLAEVMAKQRQEQLRTSRRTRHRPRVHTR